MSSDRRHECRSRRRRTDQTAQLPLVVALLLPIVLVNTLGFLVPVFNLLRMSFFEAQGTGAMREVYTPGDMAKDRVGQFLCRTAAQQMSEQV